MIIEKMYFSLSLWLYEYLKIFIDYFTGKWNLTSTVVHVPSYTTFNIISS